MAKQVMKKGPVKGKVDVTLEKNSKNTLVKIVLGKSLENIPLFA
jgi:hypothetical protein